MNLKEAAVHAGKGGTFSMDESKHLFGTALSEEVDQEALAELLRCMAQRGETVDEIVGAAGALRSAMVTFEHNSSEAVDTCGTGGDCLGSFNLSTASALVAASAGAKVIKHGNRSVSSKCGSADLLEAAGVHLELTPFQASGVFEEVGMVFLYAPSFHPAMRFVAPVRQALGIRTIFNFLGPLCSPGSVRRQLLGVGVGERLDDYARVLEGLGAERAYVVHGAGGADELTLAGKNQVRAIGDLPEPLFDAEDLGLASAGVDALEGGDASVNLAQLQSLLVGDQGAIRDAVLQNSAATLVVGGQFNTPLDAVQAAAEALDSGATLRTLNALVDASQSMGRSA